VNRSKHRPGPGGALEIDLTRLPSLPLGDLHDLWRVHFRTCKPPPKRRLLVRELAYHVQSQRLGGLDADTRKRLDAAVRAAMQATGRSYGLSGAKSSRHPCLIETTSTTARSSTPPQAPQKRPVPRSAAPVLPTAATLVRVWNGRRHEVTVVEGGRAFVYRGTTYRSLTAVARAITGTEWSGPRFFGLAARPGKEVL